MVCGAYTLGGFHAGLEGVQHPVIRPDKDKAFFRLAGGVGPVLGTIGIAAAKHVGVIGCGLGPADIVGLPCAILVSIVGVADLGCIISIVYGIVTIACAVGTIAVIRLNLRR
jgi:hypothetical protein